jgi:hypothetical protein
MGTTVSNNAKWHGRAKQKFLEVQKPFFKKRVAPATQDATQPAEEIGNSEKVCFFYTFLQGISKRAGRRRHLE